GALQAIIDRQWPDISFGYGQRIVLYHYLGDRTSTIENCLAVRAAVFADPDRDLAEMCYRLRGHLDDVRGVILPPQVGGDELLAALVSYNLGHLPRSGHTYWRVYAANVSAYRR